MKGETLQESSATRLQNEQQSNKVFCNDFATEVTTNTTSCQEWITDCQTEVHSLDTYVVEFVEEEIKEDNPTGTVPCSFCSASSQFLHKDFVSIYSFVFFWGGLGK